MKQLLVNYAGVRKVVESSKRRKISWQIKNFRKQIVMNVMSCAKASGHCNDCETIFEGKLTFLGSKVVDDDVDEFQFYSELRDES